MKGSRFSLVEIFVGVSSVIMILFGIHTYQSIFYKQKLTDFRYTQLLLMRNVASAVNQDSDCVKNFSQQNASRSIINQIVDKEDNIVVKSLNTLRNGEIKIHRIKLNDQDLGNRIVPNTRGKTSLKIVFERSGVENNDRYSTESLRLNVETDSQNRIIACSLAKNEVDNLRKSIEFNPQAKSDHSEVSFNKKID